MTKRKIIIKALIPLLVLSLIAILAYALDYPHNAINTIGCNNCHDVHGEGALEDLFPSWMPYNPQNIDDTLSNTLCWSCHNDLEAPYVRTHSSLTTSDKYGAWSLECRTCHNPHLQEQFRIYGSESYLYEGTVSSVDGTTLIDDSAGWTTDQFKGLVVIPNINESDYNYKIEMNTENTLTIEGPMNLDKVALGDTFAIVYGKSIKSTIKLDEITISPPKSGDKSVKFFRDTDPDSFADGVMPYDGVCEVCHTQTAYHRNNDSGDHDHNVGVKCTNCHLHLDGFKGGMGGGAHTTHVIEDYGPQISCTDCHGTNNPPMLADGQDLANTSVCTNCHSGDGVGNAKGYFGDNPGTWVATEGEAGYCGSCHDTSPGKTGAGAPAPNIIGDNSTYGVFVTGHGKPSGNYARLSWQDTSATGNPAANKQCGSCHDLTSQHFNTATKRLKPGYENDNNNSNCNQCHKPGGSAVAAPQWYTTYADYQNSAHSSNKCSECHNVHGASGNYAGMTKNNKENLCNTCHAGHAGHALGVSFGKDSKTYSLECISCHNVHIVSGLTSAANPNVAAMTKLTNNLEVWGDEASEKINNYAGGGTYRTPNGDILSGSQLPDYPSFCLDCHGVSQAEFGEHGGISWGGDDPHGLNSANEPNGGGTCPDRWSCGMADGWDGDDCAGTEDECWPVMTKGKGDQLWSREAYNHEERIAGANFVLSCSDCHVTHEAGIGSKLRSSVNNGPGSTIWNTMCNNCHYYYSDWHDGMSCGSVSCHGAPPNNPRFPGGGGSNTIHGMGRRVGSSGTRTFNPDLVLDMRFEGNLNDSGTWRLHGKWMDNIAGSYTSGKSGQAVVLNGGKNVQVGTRNSYWSTDDGKHGTWKYTEMKYNTTLEAWVYPTDNAGSEYSIFTKHVGYNDGGYAFTLQKINNTLRAAFNMRADNNGFTQGGASGVRGAYSSIAIPLNTWTHVAVTFDKNGPDRDNNNPAVGRIRIYVNGEDVTTSDTSGNNMQPGAGETSIFAYSENSPWNQGICHNGTWCASEFSIGGFYAWQNEFIGRIDEAKVWNVTKDATYFATYDSQTKPYIGAAKGLIGNNQLTVYFSEGVYGGGGSALDASDFSLTDTNGDNPRTITGVIHTAGASTAVITMSAPLIADDVNADTIAAVSSSIFDDYNNAAGTEAMTIELSSQCPTSPVSIQLNEPSGSTYIMDTQNVLYGAVNGGAATLTGSAYSGDGSTKYITFTGNNSCLQATTALTIETRIKPTGITADTTNYITRIFARNYNNNYNYQMSVWRNNSAYPGLYTAPAGQTSIALWLLTNGTTTWKPVLTNYTGAKTGSENDCPIVSDHWYQIKAVWNTNKPGGIIGQYFQPADIYIEDQGTDGNGLGKNWTGLINCTDTDQSLKTDSVKFFTNDQITSGSGSFAIGANKDTQTNLRFNGLIDWITWKDTVD
ncbi:MAG: hypothetical protein A3G93_15375 [Nitrospinae bacterium RIFCSPLOWO2_12_FULL_45_22]|nr:MAG: hypothetical protein A3G93_15375 [Nitrospinae bacterium RIFCSPLOWO2_12_FULL_45_22]